MDGNSKKLIKMMKLENIKTVEDIAEYAYVLSENIYCGITSVDGRKDAEVIIDLVSHCMNLARKGTIKLKDTWIPLLEKQPKFYPCWEHFCLESDTILVKTKWNEVEEAKARKFGDNRIEFVTQTKRSRIIKDVTRWMEKPRNQKTK